MRARACSVRRPKVQRTVTALLVLAAGLFMAHPPRAQAVILPAITIDGPSQQIVELGGVAMAEDGTGGLVYLKKVNGVAHVFVSRYVGGQWLAPIQVDTSDQFAASSPRIGAADGGRLVVVWSTPFATVHEHPLDELLGATLGPGASQFEEPVIIDPDVYEGNELSPDIAMSTGGQAYVVYRVEAPNRLLSISKTRPADIPEEIRLARYVGNRWVRLGAINREPGIALRPPSATNAPQVAISRTGNGIVVWQEPEVTGVARIWARRVFGNSVNYVLPVTATSFDGKPIEQDAEAPSVAMSLLGEAFVAYRQPAGPGSPLPGARIFLNKLSNGESESGAEFKGAFVADEAVAGGADAQIGPPSVDIDEHGDLRLLYDSDGTPQVVEGNDRGLTVSPTLGPSFDGPEDPAVSVMDPQGGGVSAWVSRNPLGAPAASVREDFPEGGAQTALVAGGNGGEISDLSVGRSGLGDGLVAFLQGSIGQAAIVATTVSAPPVAPILTVPRGWLKPSQAHVSWTEATSADPPISYGLVLDGHVILDAGSALQATIDPRRLGSGVHDVQVLSTDMFGNETLSPPSTLKIDAGTPVVTVARTGASIVIRVSDAQSGVETSAVSVSFGDGQHAAGRKVFRHRYAAAGVYHLVVRVRNNVGNAGVVNETVRVP